MSIHPFSLYLLHQLIFNLDYCMCTTGHTTDYQGLEVNVMG